MCNAQFLVEQKQTGTYVGIQYIIIRLLALSSLRHVDFVYAMFDFVYTTLLTSCTLCTDMQRMMYIDYSMFQNFIVPCAHIFFASDFRLSNRVQKSSLPYITGGLPTATRQHIGQRNQDGKN